jgi:hypothetical protein
LKLFDNIDYAVLQLNNNRIVISKYYKHVHLMNKHDRSKL